MQYYGDVYRPPSEANSLIIQCTVGCAHNTCTFCNMYKKDNFYVRKQEDILADLEECALYIPNLRKLFLADGDALVISTERLIEIIRTAKRLFPSLIQISSYSTVHDILRKTHEELKALKEAGLDLLYVGLESGSDKILKKIHKAMTRNEYVEACLKAKAAGLKLSVTLIFGLGEIEDSDEHIVESAKAVTLTKPDYVSFLTLHLGPGAPMFDDVRAGKFKLIDDMFIMKEMKQFISLVDSEGTVFRSNHGSNPYPIGGTFNADKERMLKEIDNVLARHSFRPKSWRGL